MDNRLIEADANGYVIIDGITYRVCGPLKSPFSRSGYGLLGAMVSTPDGSEILCHECGELRVSISASHLKYMHHMTKDDYREKHSLLRGKALVSPKLSESCRERGLERRIKLWTINRIPGDNWKGKNENKKKSFNSEEYKNRHGTCDKQNRTKLLHLAEKYNEAPENLKTNCKTRPDVHRLAVFFRTRYGSWEDGKRILVGSPDRRPKNGMAYTKKDIIRMIKSWARKNKRFPFYSDFKHGDHGLPSDMTLDKYFGNLNNLRTILGWPNVRVGWAQHRRGERVWNKVDWERASAKIYTQEKND